MQKGDIQSVWFTLLKEMLTVTLFSLMLITVSCDHSERAGVHSSTIISWQKEPSGGQCGDYCSLTDVIPNTAPEFLCATTDVECEFI